MTGTFTGWSAIWQHVRSGRRREEWTVVERIAVDMAHREAPAGRDVVFADQALRRARASKRKWRESV
jgi:hypothetical protein